MTEVEQLGKKKRPLPPLKKEAEPVASKKKERPWWARSDAELVKDRVEKLKGLYDSSKIKVDEEDRQQIIEEAVRSDPRIQNLLDMVISKTDTIGRKDDFLLVPMYSSDKRKKIAKALRLKTLRRIRLDDYGWGVWELIDGKRDVRKIGRLLSNRFGPEVEPLYPRLSKFLAYLQNLELVRIWKKK